MKIPILQIEPELLKKTYNEIQKEIKDRKILGQAKKPKNNEEGFLEIIDKWDKRKYKAYFYFENDRRCKKCTVVIPVRQLFDAKGFKATYVILTEAFGKPHLSRGMPINELNNEFYSVETEKLPHFEWKFDKYTLKHYFIDHWGNVATTEIKSNT